MCKSWGIDVEGRRMLYDPWPVDDDGAYRGPDLEENRNRYAVSGSAVRETLLYFEECGGDTGRLVELLNNHASDTRYRANRESLLDASRWYTNEYYFYFIMFTKKVIGRYDFRYGEDDPEGKSKPLSEHHKIYELGLMKKIPWGIDEEGQNIRDATMNTNLLLVLYLEQHHSDLTTDFICFHNNVMMEGYGVTREIYSREALWCSYQFILFGYEFFKVLTNENEDALNNATYEAGKKVRFLKLAASAPVSASISMAVNFMRHTNNVFEPSFVMRRRGWVELGLHMKSTFNQSNFGGYRKSCLLNIFLIWRGGVAALITMLMRLELRPSERICTSTNQEKTSFSIDYLWIPKHNVQAFFLVCGATVVLGGMIFSTHIRALTAPLPIGIFLYFILFAGLQLSGFLIYLRTFRNRMNTQALAAMEQLRELENTTHDLMKERALLETKVQERTAELAEANRKLSELDVAKTRFFANISHELRTPIALIRAPLESILHGDQGREVPSNHRLFSIMRRNTLRLSRLVDDLLSVVRIESGGMRIEPVMLDAVGTVRNYLSEFESAAKVKRIGLSFQVSGPERIPVSVDPRGLETIFLNLMSNALKYTMGGGSIDVELAADPGAGMLVLTVSDTGIGIPESKRDAVFERFKRIYDAERNEYEGCGIGLSLSREIARLHGGDITFTSEEGSGSSFTATLPLAPSGSGLASKREASSLSKDRLAAEAYEESASGDRGKDTARIVRKAEKLPRLLLVEDNHDLVEFLASSLEDSYEVVAAYDGRAALEALDSGESFDLVLSDIMMPEMDGVELFRRTREQEKYAALPFIFLTARATEEEKLGRLEMGAVDYLYKPFSVEELRAKLKAILSIRESEKKDIERRVLRAVRGEAKTPASPTTEEVLERFGLSSRERETALLLLEGKSDKEIAVALGLSTKTVSHHISSVYRKTKTDGRMGFARLVTIQ